jgi:hypothetical protein
MADRDGLAVIDRGSGEVQDFEEMVAALATAEPRELAEVVVTIADTLERFGEVRDIALGRLLEHLDKSGKWTARFGKPEDGIQYEVKADSPTAGTDSYDPDELEGQLRALVEEGVIFEAATPQALDRTVTLEMRVPLGADLEALAKALSGAKEIKIAGVAVEPLKVTPARKVKLSGVKALAKIEGTEERLEKAYRRKPPPNRRPKVTAIRAS